jgi:hypothetical protein
MLGLWMTQMSPAEANALELFSNPSIVYGIGFATIAFFSLCGVVAAIKLLDQRPGLVLSAEGIFDNSSGVSAGLVPWADIVGFSMYQVQRQKMLVMMVSSPQKCIENRNFLIRPLLRANAGISGSPITITSSSLKISFSELTDACNEYYARFGKFT